MIDNIKYIISVIYTVFKFIENCIVKPLKKILKFCEPVTKRYKAFWNTFTHDKYGDFIYKKAIILLGGTFISIYAMLSIVGFTFDLGYYLMTKHEEIIYLSDSVELEDGLWSAKGCPTKECNSKDALYFRIKFSWFNQFWELLHNRQIFFADAVAAGIPTGQTECKVISYGLRYRILMVYNYYPQILQVNCKSNL